MGLRKTFIPVLVLVLLSTIYMVEFSFFRTRVLNVSAVEADDDIGVYWDENCSMNVYSISWGALSPGDVKKVGVYVRNEGNESFSLVLTTTNWNTENASRYLSFSWSCEDNKIEVGRVVKVTQSLRVSHYTRGITDFSFDIIFETGKYLLADVNMDGVVDIVDVVIVSAAYRSTPKDPNWNPDADFNKDSVIDIVDVMLVVEDYGKTREH